MNPKQSIIDLPVYVPGKPIEEVKKEFGLTNISKLASNENPFGCSPAVREAVMKEADQLHVYPDGAALEMRELLSSFYRIELNKVIVGNGSDEIIQMIARAFYQPDSETIMADITFPRYKTHAVIEGAKVIEVPLINGKHDLIAMGSHVNDKTSVIWICNPNNPTGTTISEEELTSLLNDIPSTVLVVIDEAYFEYVTDDSYPNSLTLMEQFPNLLILRTFSKAYGLAGLRVGYGIGNEEVISLLNRVREPFNSNRIAQAAVIAALSDQSFIQKCFDSNHENKLYLQQQCKELGLTYFQTEANFILINVKQNATELFGKLLRKGVIVRSGDALGYPEHIRVTIGNRNQCEQFIEELKQILLK